MSVLKAEVRRSEEISGQPEQPHANHRVHRLLTKGRAWVDRGSAEYQRKRKDRELVALQRKAAQMSRRLVAA